MLIKINKKNKDKIVRRKLLRVEIKRVYYKFMKLQSFNKENVITYIKYQQKLYNLPKNNLNNGCYLTFRSRGVYRKFNLSRHQIRDKFKYLHGLISSSW